MKIVTVYPAYWPYVRRGVERYLHDLSQYLARRGHEVEIITSKPGRPMTVTDGDVRISYLRQVSHPLVFQYAPLIRYYAFGWEATAHLLRQRYDVAHLWSYSGVIGAPLLRRRLGLPYLFHLIMRQHHWPGRIERLTFNQLVKRANKVAVLTPGWAKQVSKQYGVPVDVLPPPVDTNVFKPENAQKDLSRPQVLFTGDLGDPRKGGKLLLRAWEEIHRRCPEAVLVLGGPFGLAGFNLEEEASSTLGQLGAIRDQATRAAVEVRGTGTVEEYPRWYAQAAVTVLPSFDEAFGMVVTESLASGTPVVCSSDGGPGEIVTSPEVGATVELKQFLDLVSPRKAHELAEAVLYAIELARQPRTSQRCREWVAPWSLEHVGQRAERLYAEIAAAQGEGPPGRQVLVAAHE